MHRNFLPQTKANHIIDPYSFVDRKDGRPKITSDQNNLPKIAYPYILGKMVIYSNTNLRDISHIDSFSVIGRQDSRINIHHIIFRKTSGNPSNNYGFQYSKLKVYAGKGPSETKIGLL